MQTDNERYRKMASLAQVGWWEADISAGYYLCSDFLCDLLGLEGDTISAAEFINMVREDYRDQTHLFIKTFTNKPFPFIQNMVKSGCIPAWLFVKPVRETMAETGLSE